MIPSDFILAFISVAYMPSILNQIFNTVVVPASPYRPAMPACPQVSFMTEYVSRLLGGRGHRTSVNACCEL